MTLNEISSAVKELQLKATLCSDGNPGNASKLRRQAEDLSRLLTEGGL